MTFPPARMGRYKEKIQAVLKEPMSANEVARLAGCNQHTAQSELLQLALEGKVRHKKVGRTHIFWRAQHGTA
ncbi:MAG: hypothetical protein JRN18_00330 [Nitrososphaerota archaeon]|jgi:predicted ArsR family transcriptional regulator|nr:hypothetical protein [Nitrososphaerota archaeon]